MKEKLYIIKIGGKVIDDGAKLTRFINIFAKLEGKKILVHGGAKEANRICKKLGIEPQMIDGRRITDEKTLDVVTMVFAGLINKKIVSQLQRYGCNALGLSGPDANIIRSHKRFTNGIDYGYAGDIDSINISFLSQILDSEIVPVLCPITHDNHGQLLNTNADTIASKLARAFSNTHEVELKFCFEFEGVLKSIHNEKETYACLSKKEIDRMMDQNQFTNGIIPKLYNAIEATKSNIHKVWICGTDNIISEINATLITP